jgi:hypothetical protein
MALVVFLALVAAIVRVVAVVHMCSSFAFEGFLHLATSYFNHSDYQVLAATDFLTPDHHVA